MPVTFLRASTDLETMVQSSEYALRKLNFEFTRNRSETVTEFEVTTPIYFRVVVEPNKMPKVRSSLLIPSIKAPEGTTLDIRFDLDAEEEDLMLGMEQAKRFVKTLANVLPSKPWAGLGITDRGREEKRWKDLFGEAD